MVEEPELQYAVLMKLSEMKKVPMKTFLPGLVQPLGEISKNVQTIWYVLLVLFLFFNRSNRFGVARKGEKIC